MISKAAIHRAQTLNVCDLRDTGRSSESTPPAAMAELHALAVGQFSESCSRSNDRSAETATGSFWPVSRKLPWNTIRRLSGADMKLPLRPEAAGHRYV